MAKKLLNSKGITPIEINIGNGPKMLDEMIIRNGGRTVCRYLLANGM